VTYQQGFQVPGDLQLSDDGKYLVFWQGTEEIAARIETRLQTPVGTDRYNSAAGLRYLDMFEKPATAGEALLRAEIWRALGTLSGVRQVRSVTVTTDRQTRVTSAHFAVDTDSGPSVRIVVLK